MIKAIIKLFLFAELFTSTVLNFPGGDAAKVQSGKYKLQTIAMVPLNMSAF